MNTQITVHFLTENHKEPLVERFIKRLDQLDPSQKIIPSIENESTVNEHTGDILLVSLNYISKIDFLNALSAKYTYINFIDPISFSQFDEYKLFSQIKSIHKALVTHQITDDSKKDWRFFDYYQALIA